MSALASVPDPQGVVLERVVALGDLKELSPRDRAAYYTRVCDSLGLSPLTQPFAYVTLNGKLTLYAKKDATDQLRKIHRISVRIVSREERADLIIVTARASAPDGREDESIGAVSIAGLKGENLANALMKAETKAKRRVTLAICGLGWLDETEVSDVRAAKPVQVTQEGEIVEDKPKVLPVMTEEAWLEWALAHTLTMQDAKTPGALKAAYVDAVKDGRAKGMSPNMDASLKQAKDQLKAKMEGGPLP